MLAERIRAQSAVRLLGRCALEGPLAEDVRAAGADLTLDLVRDACALQDDVHLLRDVLMGLLLCHASSDGTPAPSNLVVRKGELPATSR